MTHVGCETRDTEMEQSEFYFAATVLAWVKTMIMFFGGGEEFGGDTNKNTAHIIQMRTVLRVILLQTESFI